MGEGGYCSCADCKADQVKRVQRRVGRRAGPAPPRPDMGVGFWERVSAAGELRDLERKTRK